VPPLALNFATETQKNTNSICSLLKLSCVKRKALSKKAKKNFPCLRGDD
jgi:hypothetical protein